LVQKIMARKQAVLWVLPLVRSVVHRVLWVAHKRCSAGMAAGPVGAVLGGFAGALLGGLLGGAAGGATGSKCGEYVDENILDNYQCLACGYSFNKRKRK
jgi:uncharacterized protein YcfJ